MAVFGAGQFSSARFARFDEPYGFHDGPKHVFRTCMEEISTDAGSQHSASDNFEYDSDDFIDRQSSKAVLAWQASKSSGVHAGSRRMTRGEDIIEHHRLEHEFKRHAQSFEQITQTHPWLYDDLKLVDHGVDLDIEYGHAPVAVPTDKDQRVQTWRHDKTDEKTRLANSKRLSQNKAPGGSMGAEYGSAHRSLPTAACKQKQNLHQMVSTYAVPTNTWDKSMDVPYGAALVAENRNVKVGRECKGGQNWPTMDSKHQAQMSALRELMDIEYGAPLAPVPNDMSALHMPRDVPAWQGRGQQKRPNMRPPPGLGQNEHRIESAILDTLRSMSSLPAILGTNADGGLFIRPPPGLELEAADAGHPSGFAVSNVMAPPDILQIASGQHLPTTPVAMPPLAPQGIETAPGIFRTGTVMSF